MIKNILDCIEDTKNNESITENGAIGYKTTKSAMLDFFFKLSSFRNDQELREKSIKELLDEKDPYLLKFLFYIRDIRNGLGERETFRQCLKQLDPLYQISLLPLIPEYGRWDDILCLIDNPAVKNRVLNMIQYQLAKDYEIKQPSLLAKWLPSINATNKEKVRLAKIIAKWLKMSKKQYRKLLVCLRDKLNIVEKKMCAKEFYNIDYNTVPSKANLIYSNAFLKRDEMRRREYLNKLSLGDKSVKINGTVNFPSDIVCRYSKSNFAHDQALEALWKNLKQIDFLKDTIIVRDGSGSMSGTPMDVADALTIYCSEHNTKYFKNRFITFSSEPKLVSLPENSSLSTKLSVLRDKYTDISNTNLKATFDLLLRTALDNKLTNEEMPKQILIVSDMEFDEGCDNIPLMDEIALQWQKFGYKLPKLIFWNVSSRTCTIPMKENDNGVLLISGYSQNVIEMINQNEVDPYKALIKILDGERYKNIKKI